MPKPNHPLIEAVTGNPLLIDQTRADLLSATLQHLVTDPEASKLMASSSLRGDFWAAGDDYPYRPYVVHNGILQIPIQGVLLNRFSYALGRWATGYQYIEKALLRGIEDANVVGIALLVDSPGGEVAGCFELGEKIFSSRGRKPIRAFASDHAYSAAYALASSASDIIISRSGGSGSVGVVTAHYDVSKAMEDYGVKITFVFAGDHKVDGNPYQPLPEAVRNRMQARIDKLYGVFVSTVAKNRGMEDATVRDTKALTYDAEDSITVGFADKIGTLEEEMVVFEDEVAAAKDEQMSFTQEQMDAAVATARSEGAQAGKVEGKAEGVTAERTRIKAIIGSEDGKKRPKAALTLALNSGDPTENVLATLAELPEEKAETTTAPAATQTPFQTAMESTPNPVVGAVAPGSTEGSFTDGFFASFGAPAPRQN